VPFDAALQQKPPPQVPAPVTLQAGPHAPLVHVGFCVLFAHPLQTMPLLPHCGFAVPGWQVPAVAAEQQPPWHGLAVPQLLPHWLA
jgi:hypothetical protein